MTGNRSPSIIIYLSFHSRFTSHRFEALISIFPRTFASYAYASAYEKDNMGMNEPGLPASKMGRDAAIFSFRCQQQVRAQRQDIPFKSDCIKCNAEMHQDQAFTAIAFDVSPCWHLLLACYSNPDVIISAGLEGLTIESAVRSTPEP